jgi:hypothetical protein
MTERNKTSKIDPIETLKGKFIEIVYKNGSIDPNQPVILKRGICEGSNNGFLQLRTLKHLFLINLNQIVSIKVVGEGELNKDKEENDA